jgi:hypothetical protein
MSTFALFFWVTVVVVASVYVGAAIGRWRAKKPDADYESVGVVQGALLGLVGLLLAFGLSMSVGRYDSRRSIVVDEANAIGTTHLRAQLLDEPARSEAESILIDYADAAVAFGDAVPESRSYQRVIETIQSLQGDLWVLAEGAIRDQPSANAPRLFVETLNEMIDAHSSRVASLDYHVPETAVIIELFGSSIALGALSCFVTMRRRRAGSTWVAALVVIAIVFVTLDLDRPQRGLITVPTTALEDVRATMDG